MKARTGLATFLLILRVSNAAELQQETVTAWDDYIQKASAHMQERLRTGNPFLWADEVAERSHQVRAGQIVTAPMMPQNPKRVASGLIHHWIGAAFIPSTTIEEVFSVVRDYDHYKDYYHPNVIDSNTTRQSGSQDRFSMLIMNKSVLAKTALDTDYQASYFQVDTHRWYSVSCATRVQQVEEYGLPSEHKLPADQGSGFIWRLYSITRFEERDGGVYVELEAIALSRDIPVSFRWLVNPIVRRVSRGSLETSLRQTQSAVGGTLTAGIVRAWPATSAHSFRHYP